MLKPDGLFCFTCASTGRAEHGTRRTSPNDSYGTIGNLEDMNDYYKNLTIIDINEVLELNKLFSVWESYYNAESKDLYFVGIKKNNNLKNYVNNNVVNTSYSIRIQKKKKFKKNSIAIYYIYKYIYNIIGEWVGSGVCKWAGWV